MKKHLYLLAYCLFAIASVALADDPPPIGGSPDPIPADGGLSALAVTGGIYAYRKLKARKKAKAA